jgi:ribose 5-phosphate isomerase A
MAGGGGTGKRAVAAAAAARVRSGMVVGLGSGSTAELFLEALANRVAQGDLEDLVCVPTSLVIERMARDRGLLVYGLERLDGTVDLTVDGADEVDPNVDLIKGAGGFLFREKVVAQNSRHVLTIADASKRVAELGQRFPVPVETVPVVVPSVQRFLEGRAQQVTLRRLPRTGEPLVTDNGNHILDAAFGPIADPLALARELDARAGIVAHGLFLGTSDEALIGEPDGTVRRQLRPGTTGVPGA